MSKRILALALSAVLALSMVACGVRRDDERDSRDNTGNTYSSSGKNSGTTRSSTAGGDSTTRSGDSRDGGAVDGSGGKTGRSSGFVGRFADGRYGASWEQMLENGRVHDRDGFLLDGENSVTR